MEKGQRSKSKASAHAAETADQASAQLTLDIVKDFVCCDVVEPDLHVGSASNALDSDNVDVSKYLSVKERVHTFPGQAKAAIGALPFLREDIIGLRQELRVLVEDALCAHDKTIPSGTDNVALSPRDSSGGGRLPQQHARVDAADWPAIPTKSPAPSLRLLAEALQFSQTKDDIIETIFESPVVVFELSRGNGNETVRDENRDAADLAKRAASDDQAGQGEVNRFARQAIAFNGHSGEGASTALLRQEAKDIQRDRITVNGVPISDGGRSYDAIVTDFQNILKVLVLESVYGEALRSAAAAGTATDNAVGRPSSPEELDRLCRALAMVLLHAGNRTQSGGASFSEVMNLFSTPVSIIAPVSDRADPLCYDISIGPFGTPCIDGDQDAGGNDPTASSSSDVQTKLQGAFASTRWGLRCHVRANSYYKICDSNPADESTSTWVVIKAQYDSWLGHDLMLSAIARYADGRVSTQPISAAATNPSDANTNRRANPAAPTAVVLCPASAIERGISHLSTVITMESSVEATHSAEDQLFRTVHDVKEWLENEDEFSETINEDHEFSDSTDRRERQLALQNALRDTRSVLSCAAKPKLDSSPALAAAEDLLAELNRREEVERSAQLRKAIAARDSLQDAMDASFDSALDVRKRLEILSEALGRSINASTDAQLEEWPIFRKAARRVDELKVKREAVFGVMEEDEEGGEGV